MLRTVLIGLAVLCLLPALWFCAKIGHPILIAGREDGVHMWVPYVDPDLACPPDVFEAPFVTTRKLDVDPLMLNYVRTSDGTNTRWNLWVEPWVWAVLFALPSVTWAVFAGAGKLRREQGQSGHCPACGYDLRATPERCPECGFQPTPAGGQR